MLYRREFDHSEGRRVPAPCGVRSATVVAGSILGLVTMAGQAVAETFDSAASSALDSVCSQSYTAVSVSPGLPTVAVPVANPLATGNLSTLCSGIVGSGATPTTVGLGAISAPTAAAFIEERRRLSEEDGSGSPAAGASSDSTKYNLGGGLSAFINAGGEALNHFNNKFEDGYSSAIVPTLTVGADYRIADWMTAGLAFNYFYQNGTYDDGGRFNTHSYGPLLFASFVPIRNVFADIALGYSHQDYFRNRPAQASAGGTTFTSGHARGNYNGDQYSAGLLAGYTHPFQGFSLGPRVGVNYIYYDVENYSESSSSGLALRYSGLNQSSLQTTLGAVATMPISTSFGVVQPQMGVSWVHEFLNDSRNIQAQFLDTTNPASTEFTFQREQPARNWAVIDLAVSVVLPNRLQPFVSFTTIQGNENFASYGGLLGARVSF